MRIRGQAVSLALILPIAAALCPGAAARTTDRAERPRSARVRIIRANGAATLEVDGAPFFILGAQCDIWRSTRQDARTVAFFDGYQAMNATVVSVGIPWSKIEPQKDRYDFAFLDWFIHQARLHRLKLIINLFDSNICGKVQEGAGASAYPQYTPSYILDHPLDYQRMVLTTFGQYDPGGPPMCPNDPRTLERERRLVVRIARHLKTMDAERTVLMMQIDNEFYYQQWVDARPVDEPSVRCLCPLCEAKWKRGGWKSGEDFTFRSFAAYVKTLSDAIASVSDIPLYLNSPWWAPHIVPIFLNACPNLSLVGVDGMFTPREPNMLSRSLLGRNIPFAAENPTEQPETRANLDVLPYYTLLGPQGIGNLLWECGPPHTVVDDPAARKRYGDALYPLKYAEHPIAEARGTTDLLGWYAIRDYAPGAATDEFGNLLPAHPGESAVTAARLFVREGRSSRIVQSDSFEAMLGRVRVRISGSAAGVMIRIGRGDLVLAIPAGHIGIGGIENARAEVGRFEGARWTRIGPVKSAVRGGEVEFDISRPQVIRLYCTESSRAPRP